MAVYKVAQDVEAEDKLLGPLTLKQFIYGVIVFISVFLMIKLSELSIFLIIIPLPFALFFGLLIFLGLKNTSQPAETYLAALVRFYFKPRRRIWSQDGYFQPVLVTAPKKQRKNFSDGLSNAQVRRRLDKLASLMDSRGWAAKDTIYQPNIVVPTNPTQGSDDRLIPVSQLFKPAQPSSIHTYEDVMDEQNNPTAQNFAKMVEQTTQRVHQEALSRMNNPNYDPYPAEMHQRVVQPVSPEHQLAQPEQETQPKTAEPPTPEKNTSKMTSKPSDAILNLVNNSGDNLSVSTIEKEAQRLSSLEDDQTVSLH